MRFSEGIERMRYGTSPFIYKVTIDQGNGKYVDKYIQQITSKTIVLIQDYKTVLRFNLDGTSRKERRGVPELRITMDSLKAMFDDMHQRGLKVQHSTFCPFKIESFLMIDQPKMREKYKTLQSQEQYITEGKRVIDCTLRNI